MQATSKNPQIDAFLETLTGRNRVHAVSAAQCVVCGGTAATFRDALSEREYQISGMCQDCQDDAFEPEDGEPTDEELQDAEEYRKAACHENGQCLVCERPASRCRCP